MLRLLNGRSIGIPLSLSADCPLQGHGQCKNSVRNRLAHRTVLGDGSVGRSRRSIGLGRPIFVIIDSVAHDVLDSFDAQLYICPARTQPRNV